MTETRKQRILIIEDDKHAVTVYKKKLEAEYELMFAMDGVEGIRIAKEKSPDFIVLDLILPGEASGMRVLSDLKEYEITKDIPILVLTNLEGQHQTVIENGALDCLIKSNTSINQVATMINRYFDNYNKKG